MLIKKLVQATKYDIDLPDWDINRIKRVGEIYGKILKDI